jgi:hypothetical protein
MFQCKFVKGVKPKVNRANSGEKLNYPHHPLKLMPKPDDAKIKL